MKLKLTCKDKQEACVIIPQIAKVNVSSVAPPCPPPASCTPAEDFNMQRGVSASRSRLLVYVIQQRSYLTLYLLDHDVAEALSHDSFSFDLEDIALLTWQSHHCTGLSVTTDEQHRVTGMCRKSCVSSELNCKVPCDL